MPCTALLVLCACAVSLVTSAAIAPDTAAVPAPDTVDRAMDGTVNSPVNQTVNQAVDQGVEQSVEETIDQTIDDSVDQTVNQTVDWSAGRAGSRAARFVYGNITESGDPEYWINGSSLIYGTGLTWAITLVILLVIPSVDLATHAWKKAECPSCFPYRYRFDIQKYIHGRSFDDVSSIINRFEDAMKKVW